MRNSPWVTTKEASVAIGFSSKTLKRRIEEGVFECGVHFRQSGPSKSSWYLFNIPECLKALDQADSNG
tara:strand:- start:287 stop:490 length:204 start_codon:yes stop_codon:yes gene_type:complete